MGCNEKDWVSEVHLLLGWENLPQGQVEREHCLEMRAPQGTGVEKSDLVPHLGQP